MLLAIAQEHGLHLYEAPSTIGNDIFGYVLSRQTPDLDVSPENDGTKDNSRTTT
jgi:hypothetical protein